MPCQAAPISWFELPYRPRCDPMRVSDLAAWRRRRAPTAVEELSDEALMELVAAGGNEAVAELRARYGSRIEALGFRLLGDRGLAEELTQETFLRLWRRAAAFDRERGSVATFLFTIARRAAVDLWRSPSSRPVDDPAVAGRPSPPPDEIAPLLTGLAVRDALGSAVRGPSHRHRIRLLPPAEPARDRRPTRRTVGTVKSRTFHALRALRAALSEGVAAS